MQVRPSGFRAIAVGVATVLLSGCDLLLLSPSMPGLMPGIGRPHTGRVLDSQTGLPIGKATVAAGWGATNTDNAGNFSLYGDFSGGKNISFSRAGYVSATYAMGTVAEGDTYYLDPSFATNGALSRRDLNLTGTLLDQNGSSIKISGNVSFAGAASSKINESTGGYGIKVTAGLPGSVFSGVLAGGQITGGPVESESQPFSYMSFGYRLVDIPSVVPDSTWVATANVQVQATSFTDMTVVYKNLGAFSNPSPRTDVLLDFGMLGSVPVGRGFSTSQALRVPKVDGAKYVVSGEISDNALQTQSKAVITTPVTATVNFELLAPPKVTGPAKNAVGVGTTPTFSWEKVNKATSYFVVVSEDTGSSNLMAKWKGYTTSTSITFPGFWDSDFNGGVLFPQASYSWEVHALRSDVSTIKSAVDLRADLPSVKPNRQSKFESLTKGGWFSR